MEEVYANLQAVGTSYIILEDSLCYGRPDDRWPACLITDIIDRCNGHQLDEPTGIDEEDLVPSKHDRFCSAIDTDPLYDKLFKKAFRNNTFRVYRVVGKTPGKNKAK